MIYATPQGEHAHSELQHEIKKRSQPSGIDA